MNSLSEYGECPSELGQQARRALLGRADHGLSNQKSGHKTVSMILDESFVASTLWLVNQIV